MEGLHDLQFYDYVRIALALIALFSLVRIANLYRLRGKGWDSRLLDIAWVMAGLLFAVVYGMTEQVLSDTGFGSRMIVTALPTLLSIRATRKSNKPLQVL